MKNNCDRCKGELKLSIMSNFNTDQSVMSCSEDEQQAPATSRRETPARSRQKW